MLASSCIQFLLKFRFHEVSVPKHFKTFTALEQALQNSSNLAMHFILIYRCHKKR